MLHDIISIDYKIENRNYECVKETTNRLNSRKQPGATNGSSTQLESSAPGGLLQLAPKQKCVVIQLYCLH